MYYLGVMAEMKLIEDGNGLPSAGDYVQGDDGLYHIISVSNGIFTGRPGEGNWSYCEAVPVDWSACEEDVFPAKIAHLEETL